MNRDSLEPLPLQIVQLRNAVQPPDFFAAILETSQLSAERKSILHKNLIELSWLLSMLYWRVEGHRVHPPLLPLLADDKALLGALLEVIAVTYGEDRFGLPFSNLNTPALGG